MSAAGKIERGKTRDATNVRALVRRVSEIVESHIGSPLSKGSFEFDFLEELGKLANPRISFHSMKGAIESLSSEKLASKKPANPG